MNDTIVLRIHNLKKYETLVNTLHKKGKGSVTNVYADESTGEVFESKEAHHVFYHDTNTFVRLAHRNSLFIGSSHYNLSYLLSFSRDFIEFNFSIPKYKYGTNVVQFIDYFNQNNEAQFRLLMEFLRGFLQSFICKIDAIDVEIVQIDFCYNQFFLSKENALNYLKCQIPVLQKFARSNGRPALVLKNETLMFVTDRYSFKIYHKGTEFRKHDYYELSNKGLTNKFDLPKMADIADRILRYEVSFRSSYLTYMFKRMYQTGSDFTGAKTCYRHLWKGLRIERKKFSNKKFHIASDFDKFDKVRAKYPDKYVQFFEGNNIVTFDQKIFNCLYKFFWEMFFKFQITSTGSMEDVRTLIAKINEDEILRCKFSSKKPKLIKEKYLLRWIYISQTKSLKEMMRAGAISKSQYYIVIALLKRIGLTEYNPKFSSPKPSTGYQDYKFYFGGFH